jgi:DNA-binding NarL/FixJ family response regulator
VLSQFVEESYAAELLSAQTSGVGYLMKDRVSDMADFRGAVERVAVGGTAIDPGVVRQILARTHRMDPLAGLTPPGEGGARPHGRGTLQQLDRWASRRLPGAIENTSRTSS